MSDVDDIRRRMALIRRDMHLDVSQVVGGVEEVMDWRSILRNHPYITIGVSLAVGYYIVPKRRRRPEHPTTEVRPLLETSSSPRAYEEAPAKPRKSLARKAAGWAMGMLWPLVSQSVQAYAAMWLESQLKQHLDLNPQPTGPGDSSPSARDDPYGGGPVYRMPRRG